MAQMLIRNLEDDVKAKLKRRAEQHGRSTEEEVREILRAAVRSRPPAEKLGTRIASYFKDIGLTEPLEELPRQPARPADLASPRPQRRKRP